MKLIHLLYIIIVVILAVLLYSYLKEVGGKMVFDNRRSANISYATKTSARFSIRHVEQ